MHRARRSPAAVVWLCVALLLWQAAVPWLAARAAQARDRFTAEVCSVYGVRDVSTDTAPADDAAGHPAASHCALGGLLNGSVCPPAELALALGPRHAQARVVMPPRQPARPDATRRWVAFLKQGPPPRA